MAVFLYMIFFLSGVAGLVYEVSWTRQIGLLFGQTVHASAIVLSSYFAGMAIGYALAGRLSVRVKRPLIGYAICEAIVGAWAFVVPQILHLVQSPSIGPLLSSESASLQLMIRSVFSLLLLSPATIALGATLPLMAAALGDDGKERRVTYAYAANIAGAVVGVVLGTIFGIMALGVAGTSFAAALLSGFCAVSAISLRDPRQVRSPDSLRHATPARQMWRSRWAWLSGLSGFGILALQVLYLRLFSLVLHNSVYTFGAVVAAVLVALALGSWFIGRFGDTFDRESGIVAALQSGGIAIASSLLVFLLWSDLEYFTSGEGFWEYLAGVFAFVGGVVILPVAILGVVLPWVWTGAARAAHDKPTLGTLTAINTVAAALGSAVASFVLLPAMGLWGSFIALAVVYVAAGFFVSVKRVSVGNVLTTGSALVFCAAAVVATKRFDGLDADEKMVQRWESAYGWIDVVEVGTQKTLKLRQNVHYGMGSSSSITMERKQANIPLLLHPNPRDVLFIGLATGITAGTALDHPSVTSTEVVELIPDVLKGAALFDAFNNGITRSERAKIHINDGRHHLYATDKKYDVIVADLFVPWESHTGYLYTVEHYAAARRRLNIGGIFCQWIPLWQLGERELRLIADSFASVFPFVSVWYGKQDEHWTALGLVGSEEPITIDASRLGPRLASPPKSLPGDKSWLASPEQLYALYAGDWRAAKGATLNSDEWPRVEFLTPLTAWTRGARLRFDELERFVKEAIAALPRDHVQLIRPELEPPNSAH